MSNWKEYKLNDIVDLVHGYQFRDTDFVNDGIPVIKISNVKGSDLYLDNLSYVSNERLKEFEDVVINNGDILMSLTGNIGRVVVVRGLNRPMFQNYRVGKFEPIDGRVDKSYLKYLLSDSRLFDQLSQYSNQSAQANFGKQDLNKLRVSIPTDVKAQQKIAKILSIIDGQIEKTEAIIAKYQAIKQGVLQDLFTRGIDVTTGKLRPRHEDAPELYKDSPLGMIPKAWEVVRLEQICQMKSGDGITSESITDIGEYPVYGGNGLRGYTSQYTHEGYYVLIGRQGALCGNIAKARGKFYASEHAVVVTLNNQMDTDWIAEKLEMMTLNKYSEASAQPGLSVTKILRLNITKPTHNEQENISAKVVQLNTKLLSEEKQLSKIRFIKQGLMSDLLSGKVEVIA